MLNQPAQPFFAHHLGGVGRRPFGRRMRPAWRRVPKLPPFCVRNCSDPKTTERDAKSVSIFLVMTCGFRQREYCDEERPSRGAFTSAANKRDLEVVRKRLGRLPSAFRVFRHSRKDLRQSPPWPRALPFGRDRMEFERNHEGPSRTTRIRVKTL
jgi:hypothetical protein